jgi:hypothetical protein
MRLLLAVLALAAPPPKLAVTPSSAAIVVRGGGFAPTEVVSVRVIGRRVVKGATRTTREGRFTIRLARPKPLVCGRLVVRAAGAKGDSAALRIGPSECNPAG